MRYLTVTEVLDLHRRLIEQSGGSRGLRDRGVLVSAVRQPQMQFGGEELYASIAEKAAALGYALIQNHPFVDGNKRGRPRFDGSLPEPKRLENRRFCG